MPKILVVEDERQIREEITDWLAYDGYTVEGAENGRLGLAAIHAAPPDLILCDIAMPELDGHEVLIDVRSSEATAQVPFIFLTAAAGRTDIRKGMEMGADDYLTKPFTHNEVLNAVRTQLARAAAHRARIEAQTAILHEALSEEREKRLIKSQMIAMLSHDFRNPLAAISTASSIIRTYEDRLTAERRARHLDNIDRSVRSLLQMMDDLLMMAEFERGHVQFRPEPLRLSAYIGEIVEEFRLIDQGAHRITYRNSAALAFNGDPKLIRQIMANLLSNAIKYSAANTEITVELDKGETSVQICVRDRGIGIPSEYMPP